MLLEYAAYRLYNVLSPISLRARVATVDYVDQDGRGTVTRTGFFAEDPGDAAKRNGLFEVKIVARVAPSAIDGAAEARAAMFEYMIGNLDWSMRGAHAGESCCHNFKLLGTTANAQSGLIPVPYDFDFSGLVDAPYATPPDAIPIGSVRERVYRGYCVHHNEARAIAADLSARRGELLGLFPTIAGMDARTRAKATDYLNGFFRDLDSGKALKGCVR